MIADKSLVELVGLHTASLKGISSLRRLIQLGRLDLAEQFAKPQLGNDKFHVLGLVGLVLIACHQKRASLALAMGDRLRRVAPNDALSWALAGAAYLQARAMEDAEAAYRHAVSMAPERLDYLVGLAYAVEATGVVSRVQPVLDRLIGRLGDRSPARSMLIEAVLDLQLASSTPLVAAAYLTADGVLHGWAWDRTSPTQRQAVVCSQDGACIADATAELSSSLLRSKGVGDGCHGFALAVPPGVTGIADVRLVGGETALAGAPIVIPSGTAGWLETGDGRYVTGWAKNRSAPARPVSVVITSDVGQEVVIKTSPPPSAPDDASSKEVGGFIADFGPPPMGRLTQRYEAYFRESGQALRGSPMQVVSARRAVDASRGLSTWFRINQAALLKLGMPAESYQFLRRDLLPLAHQHAWREAFGRRRLPELGAPDHGAPEETRIVDVVIPVYRGVEDTLACIEAVLRAKNKTRMHLVLIDDATPEPTLATAIRSYASRRRVTVLRNATNRGFVVSVNRGMALHPDRDVILLNSDTLVHGNWLDRLVAAAEVNPNVGTITPLSNTATICSYPEVGRDNVFPDPAQLVEIDTLCASLQVTESIEIPTGVGFCMYIRRACLDDVGLFDADLWGRGYGEENDFCLKAAYLGWQNVATPNVYVAHRGGTSFGDEGNAQLSANLRRLNLLHPGYDNLIAGFQSADPLAPYRKQLDLARLRRVGPQRVILQVTHALGGGTERHVSDLVDDLAREGVSCLILRPVDGGRLKLDVPEAWMCPNLIFDPQTEDAELFALLRSLAVAHVHFHHFHDLPEALLFKLPEQLGCTYDVTIHDYSWICPRITLIDATGRYCGEPQLERCEQCLSDLGSRLPGVVSVATLRASSGDLLSGARRVFVPTEDVQRRLRRYFPAVDFTVRPHPEAETRTSVSVPPIQSDRNLRVAIIGAIGDHKGYRELVACAEDARQRGLALKFIVIGHTQDDPALFRLGNVFVSGKYREVELPALLTRFRCDAALFLSVWPETWAYTLSAAIAGGLLPIAYDLGAFAERIRKIGVGVLFPLGLSAREINDLILKACQLYRTRPARHGHLGVPAYRDMLNDYYELGSRWHSRAARAPSRTRQRIRGEV